MTGAGESVCSSAAPASSTESGNAPTVAAPCVTIQGLGNRMLMR